MNYINDNFPVYGKLLGIFSKMTPSFPSLLTKLREMHQDEYDTLFPSIFQSSELTDETLKEIKDILMKYRNELSEELARDEEKDTMLRTPIDLDDYKKKEKMDITYCSDTPKKKEPESQSKSNTSVNNEDKAEEKKKSATPFKISMTIEDKDTGDVKKDTLLDSKSLRAIRNNLHKLIPDFPDDALSDNVITLICMRMLLRDNLHPISQKYNMIVSDIVDKIKTCRLPEGFEEQPYAYSYIVPALILYLQRVDNTKYNEWLKMPEMQQYHMLEELINGLASPITSGFDVSDYLEYDFSSQCYRFKAITGLGKESFLDTNRHKLVYDRIRENVKATGVIQEAEMTDEFLKNLLFTLGVKDDGTTLYNNVNNAYAKLRAKLIITGRATDKYSHMMYIVPCMTYRIYRVYKDNVPNCIPANAYLSPANFIDEFISSTLNLSDIEKDFNEDVALFDANTFFVTKENSALDEKLSTIKISPATCDSIRLQVGLNSEELSDTDIKLIIALVLIRKEHEYMLECMVSDVSKNTDCTNTTDEFYKNLILKLFEKTPTNSVKEWLTKAIINAGVHNKARYFVNRLERNAMLAQLQGSKLKNAVVEDKAEPSDISEGVNITAQDSFDKVLKEMSELHHKKNQDYGDAAHKAYQRHGIEYYLIMLDQKLLRATNLNKSQDKQQNFESIEDSLLDMANYAVMAVDSLRRDSQKDSMQ